MYYNYNVLYCIYNIMYNYVANVNNGPEAGPPVSAPKSCLPSKLFQTGKGDGWDGHSPVMAPSRAPLPWARHTFSSGDNISLSP